MNNMSFFGWVIHTSIHKTANAFARIVERVGSGSLLHAIHQRVGNKKVQYTAWIVLMLSFFVYMASAFTAAIPTSYSLVHEMLVYVGFFVLVMHRREWGIPLFAFYLPFLTYRPLLVLLLILVLFLFVDGVAPERLRAVLRNKANVGIGVFMLLLLLSSAASAGWLDSLKNYGLYYVVSMLLYFLVLLHVDTKRVLKLVVIGLIAGAVMISLYGALQYATLDFTEAKWVDQESNPLLTKRAAATFGNPNIFAQYLLLVAPLAFVAAFYSSTWRARIYMGGAFLIIVFALVLTFSRGAWAALFVAGLLLALLVDRRLILIGVIAVLVGIQFVPDVIMDRLVSIFNTEDSSALYRFDAWQSAFAMIGDYWLTGIGMDEPTFLRIYPDYMINDVRVFHFHNTYLMHFVMGGILGLFMVLFLFYTSFRSLVTSIFVFRKRDAYVSGVAKGLFAAILAIAIAALTEDIWRHYAVIFTFWFIIALIAVLVQLRDKGETDHA